MWKESLLMKEKYWWSSEAHKWYNYIWKPRYNLELLNLCFPLVNILFLHSLLLQTIYDEKNEFIFVKFHTGLARDTPSDHP